MNKLLSNLFSLLLLTTCVFFASCSDDDDEDQKVTIRFEAAPYIEGALNVENLAGLPVTFTEVRTQNATQAILDNRGVAEVELYKGTYNIAIEETIKNAQGDDVVVAVRIENLSINTPGQVVEGKVNSLPQKALGQNFIFSEVFFNGERNSGRMMHPDQYMVIFNPTNEVLYADGLCIAVTQQWAGRDKEMWYDEYYPTRVPIGGFITIPGSGKENPIQPGDKFVIAFSAIDHSKVEGYDHAVDLTGADFEIYPDNYAQKNDVDNPEVKNVLCTDNKNEGSNGFFFQPRGYVSPLMFKLENGEQSTINAFVKANTSRSKHFIPANEDKGTPEAIVEIDILSVETKNIIEGIQTSDVPNDVKTRVIPIEIDRGKFIVNGCHRQELAVRKTIAVGDKIFYQDTNNSLEDFVPLDELKAKGIVQTSFPKGWRNK